MPVIDPNALKPLDRYRLMIGSVVPRPIAWVSTVNSAGVVNLAPFSFFTGVGSKPCSLMISIGYRDPAKDTLRNLRNQGEAVVQLPPQHLLDQMHQTGGEYKSDLSELDLLEIAHEPAEVVAPPRVAGCDIAMECRFMQEVLVGDPDTPATAVFLEVLRVHVSDQVAAADGLPDPHKLMTVGRLGDRAYLAGEGWQVQDRDKQRVPDEHRRQR
ncbi:MAG: flavin reductase family protein [Planctomycetota bacterium]|jgi:flavin reductase (DIM6/NTAB) family NADH-FMN oxidoreductase RutF|nr:flavin reductase family protein [Planctomycetota bacterium]